MSSKKKKKPYQKPTIKTESVIESATLACGKCLGTGPTGIGTQPCSQFKRKS